MKVLCVDPDLHLAFSSLFKFISDSGGFTMQVNYNIVHLSLLPGAIFDMEHIWVHKTTIVFFFIFYLQPAHFAGTTKSLIACQHTCNNV